MRMIDPCRKVGTACYEFDPFSISQVRALRISINIGMLRGRGGGNGGLNLPYCRILDNVLYGVGY